MSKSRIDNFFTYQTPIGKITLLQDNIGVTNLYFGEKDLQGIKKSSQIMNKAATQLQQYFAGKRQNFSIATHIIGTNFQKNVWRAITQIPYGETKTYQQIAIDIGKPQSARAVGGACNKNPLPIFIPCHRVVGKNGVLGGYQSDFKLKQFLLDLENNNLLPTLTN